MNILIIGGTRNLGHFLTAALLERGHHVTLLNRGKSPDELPPQVERLRADRTDPHQLERALAGRDFDAVVDNAIYKGSEAETIIRLLEGHTGHYLFLSTGQVYLVREGVERPFDEDAYEGRIMPAPKINTYSYEEWLYGVEKRQVEDVMARAHATRAFPYTSLRLPMVNSERDHHNRLYGYWLRLKDGGPILVPETPDYPLRHVYGGDVVQAILRCLDSGPGRGSIYNISQDETVMLDEFLEIVGSLVGVVPRIVRVRRSALEAGGFLPDCSPFSERWMSELTNERGKSELGMVYTPLPDYLAKIVSHYESRPVREPASYRRRQAEISFALQAANSATP
ncbi:MAG: NAD-dependent epimerase/dehydratase family protein [Anaerolineae bacterium]|nr:NAD-dependent epimerase/dehydratase family protein [Anaerolineae bacterium]